MYSLEDALKKLEKQMRKSQVVKDVIGAMLYTLNEVDEQTENLPKQIRPSTATVLLAEWEKEFGLEIRNGYPDKFRQETLLAKEKGAESVTKTVIKNTAEGFSGAEVEVNVDTDESLIFIKFVGTIGIPKNMEDLKKAIDDIIPAHMEVQYEYVYNTWKDVKKLTWGELKERTWKQVKEERLNARNN